MCSAIWKFSSIFFILFHSSNMIDWLNLQFCSHSVLSINIPFTMAATFWISKYQLIYTMFQNSSQNIICKILVNYLHLISKFTLNNKRFYIICDKNGILHLKYYKNVALILLLVFVWRNRECSEFHQGQSEKYINKIHK